MLRTQNGTTHWQKACICWDLRNFLHGSHFTKAQIEINQILRQKMKSNLNVRISTHQRRTFNGQVISKLESCTILRHCKSHLHQQRTYIETTQSTRTMISKHSSNHNPTVIKYNSSNNIHIAKKLQICFNQTKLTHCFGRISITEIPVSLSPLSIVWMIGDAPRHRGRMLGCTLRIPLKDTKYSKISRILKDHFKNYKA